MKILVTGAAGFIGAHLTQRLLARGDRVIGLDNMNPYYDVTLKQARLSQFDNDPNFSFVKLDLIDRNGIQNLFAQHQFDVVVNLAAQAGVRYSLENPLAYIDSNVVGFAHILESCRQHAIPNLVYASSSSVYGANTKQPFVESDNVDHPLSLYAASKKANELMAHTYSHLYQLPCTGLRFFTVYGPWGRPDMALFKFTRNILAGEPIDVYNHGDMIRDFTYIDDIISGVLCVIDHPASKDSQWSSDDPNPATSNAPYRLYNIGNNNPVQLTDFIAAVEAALGKTAKKNYLAMQPGDVASTHADVSALEKDFGFKPKTSIQSGVKQFIDWYRMYYDVK